jgi:hypothetical protein
MANAYELQAQPILSLDTGTGSRILRVRCHDRMSVRRTFVICGVFVALVTLVSVWFVTPVSYRTPHDVSLFLTGYTNVSGTNIALFEVTNRTKIQFVCFVGPRSSLASRNGRPLFRDLSAAALPGTLPPLGVFAFSVPSSADTNLWHVSVQLQELNFRPKWQRAFATALRMIGLHWFEPKVYNLTSPAFGRGAQ